MSNDRPARSARPSGGDRSRTGPPRQNSTGKSSSRPSGKPTGRTSGKSTGRTSGKSTGDRRGSSARREERPLTAAEKRKIEVKRSRAPRAPQHPDHERLKIEQRTVELWIDDGSVRDEAVEAAARAGAVTAATASKRRPPKPLEPEIAAELVGAVGKQRGARLAERLAQASEALDRERYQEARRLAGAIAKEAPDVAAAHEVLGLACYRLGLYKPAVRSLEMALDLHPNPAIMPVVADCYRALGRWSSVERVWLEIKELSPSQEVLAEGRIVAAGALADQGKLKAAIDVMEPATKRVKVVREFHLREWYVVADLHDRVGDAVSARRWFVTIADIDPEFADVTQRLRTLGR
jgi:tetratricopeptide (TPR) repeat protein